MPVAGHSHPALKLSTGFEVDGVLYGFTLTIALTGSVQQMMPTGGRVPQPGQDRYDHANGVLTVSITLKRSGSDVQVLEGAQTLPEGLPVQLFTEHELVAREHERRATLDLQMPSFIRGDEDEDAGELFFL